MILKSLNKNITEPFILFVLKFLPVSNGTLEVAR